MNPPIGRRSILSFGVAALGARVLAACGGASKDAALPVNAVGTNGWASGGTAAMKDKASYPDPFAEIGSASSTCKVTCKLTEGPCYSSQAEEIRDISYGQPGLPMQMRLRIVDASCKPIVGALVDVWHVSPVGKYSGDDPAHEQVGFCTGDDPAFTTKLYFRGKQKTDANGVAIFDTCFPGWYHGRTVHVHMTVSVNGEAFVTTQLGFADALDDEILSTQKGYSERGSRDTANANDSVMPRTNVGDYLFDTKKMTDGALLASKTFVLRAKTSDPICGDDGPPHGPGGPGGGPGGPPPPGGFGHGPPPPGHPPPPRPDGGAR